MKNATDHKENLTSSEKADEASDSTSESSMETSIKELDDESVHTLASTFLNDGGEEKGDLLECSEIFPRSLVIYCRLVMLCSLLKGERDEPDAGIWA